MRLEPINKSRSLSGASDLTLFAPITPGFAECLDSVTCKTRIQRLLQALHAGRTSSLEYTLLRATSDAVERVGRIHSVRVLIHGDAVMLSATFDGTFEAYIRVLWQRVGSLLDLIFQDTVGYVTAADHRFDDWLAWARTVQAETPFFYSSPQFTREDVRWHTATEALRRAADDETLDAEAGERAALRWRLDTVEAETWARVAEQTPQATLDALRQGLESLAALYRLTDLYQPNTVAGDRLHRGARDLLLEFTTLLDRDQAPPQLLALAMRRFGRQLQWLRSPPRPPAVADRLGPPLPETPPVLARDDIPALVLESAGSTHTALLWLAFGTPGAADLLEALAAQASSASSQGRDAVVVQVAFTVEGLRACGLTEDELGVLPSEFREGMEARAAVLGDFRSNHPRRWTPPWAWDGTAPATPPRRIEPASVHALLQLRVRLPNWPLDQRQGTDNEPWRPGHPLQPAFEAWRATVQRCGATLLAVQGLQSVARHLPGADGQAQWRACEHFGYSDGDEGSDPGVDPVPPATTGYRNQVHPGELLIGHANQADAPPRPNEVPAWLHNGSYLVVRQLVQDVPAFEAVLDAAAQAAALDRELVAAKLMGRWRDGRPLAVRANPSDRLNGFDFTADPQGKLCPFHAHIRRVNPRQALGMNEPPGRHVPRIVRRGMSYGPTFEAQPEAERGLVFMAYNARIAEQFEVLQGWLAGGNSSGAHSQVSDPLMGVPGNGEVRHFGFEAGLDVNDPSAPRVTVALDGADQPLAPRQPLVRLAWGAYLLVPARPGLRWLQATAAERAHQAPVPVWSEADGERQLAALLALEPAPGLDADAKAGAEAKAREAWKAALEDPLAQDRFQAAALWAALRRRGPVRTAYGVLLADADLVARALAAEGDLSVAGYQPRLASSIGPIFLGLDRGEAYEQESRTARQAIQAVDAASAFALTVAISQRTIGDFIDSNAALPNPQDRGRWGSSVDLQEWIQPVLAQLCTRWFGIAFAPSGTLQIGALDWQEASGVVRIPGHVLPPSRHAFQPWPKPTVAQAAERFGPPLTAALRARLQADPHAFDAGVMSGPVMQALREQGGGTLDVEAAACRIVGLMMGFLPTAEGALKRLLNEWLKDGSFWRLREAWLRVPERSFAAAQALFTRPLTQALQLRPAPELLWRTARRDGALGLKGVEVLKGDVVVLGLVSATQQRLLQGQNDLSAMFGWDVADPEAAPSATHACPGRQAAMGVLLGFVAAVLGRPETMRPSPVALALQLSGPLAPPPADNALPPVPDPAINDLLAWAEARPRRIASTPLPAGSRVLGLGDSWFHYFAFDLFDQLKYGLGVDAVSLAVEGTPSHELLRQRATWEAFDAAVHAQAQAGCRPRAVALSIGGNDVVEAGLKRLLRPRAEAGSDIAAAVDAAAWSTWIVQGLLARTRCALVAAAEVCARRCADGAAPVRVPLLLHGYDHPWPDGRGLAGPGTSRWLWPVFQELGYSAGEARAVMVRLIDQLNGGQQQLVDGLRAEGHDVHHVDLRGTLATAADWNNELHPTFAGFQALARRFAAHLPKAPERSSAL